MGEAVQHAGILYKGGDSGAVFLLIEKEAGLLAFLYVNPEVNAVLDHLHPIRHIAADEAFGQLETLQRANGYVAALIDARRMQQLLQRVGSVMLEALHAQRQTLHDQHVAEAVHDQRGQTVAFGKNHAAGMQIGKGTAVIDGLLYAAENKVAVNRLVMQRHHPQRNLRLGIIERPTEKSSAAGQDVYYVAGCEAALNLPNIAAENPRMTAEHAFLFAGIQNGLCHEIPP